VVENALDPETAAVAVLAVGQHGGIFDRNALLIIETISHPALNSFTAEAPFIHLNVEGVMNMVVALFATQLPLEFLSRPGGSIGSAAAD